MSRDLVLAIVTAVLGLLTAGILALVNSAISARAGIDENLRDKRLAVYPALWTVSGAFSRWPEQTVTREALEKLHQDLRSWYYADGGIFLSETARARYGDVQELIAELLKDGGGPHDVLEHASYTDLKLTASAMRTALTEDLNTRRRPSLWQKWQRWRRHRRFAREAKARIDVSRVRRLRGRRRESARGGG
jgi:hypothetical protein